MFVSCLLACCLLVICLFGLLDSLRLCLCGFAWFWLCCSSFAYCDCADVMLVLIALL